MAYKNKKDLRLDSLFTLFSQILSGGVSHFSNTEGQNHDNNADF